MRAVVIDYEKKQLSERDVREPRLTEADDVLFQVTEVGVCGTDRELASFRLGYGPSEDGYLVPGHEAVGEVIASNSPMFSPGDLVVPAVRRECQLPCESCRRERRDLCVTGGFTERGIFGQHGYFTEFAVDRAGDLVRIPVECADVAVLTEPLSVVEKAIALAVKLHPGEPRRALVLGAGSIGLLAAATLRLRGFEVEVVSVEHSGSDRARLAALAGADYRTKAGQKADVVIEAAGSPNALTGGIAAMAPLGVLIVLGALRTEGSLPLLDLIVGNQIIAGSVNASPESFTAAVADLPRLPRGLLKKMIQYRSFEEYRSSFTGAPEQYPKIVHRITGSV